MGLAARTSAPCAGRSAATGAGSGPAPQPASARRAARPAARAPGRGVTGSERRERIGTFPAVRRRGGQAVAGGAATFLGRVSPDQGTGGRVGARPGRRAVLRSHLLPPPPSGAARPRGLSAGLRDRIHSVPGALAGDGGLTAPRGGSHGTQG